jgi:hypothetical protein
MMPAIMSSGVRAYRRLNAHVLAKTAEPNFKKK